MTQKVWGSNPGGVAWKNKKATSGWVSMQINCWVGKMGQGDWPISVMAENLATAVTLSRGILSTTQTRLLENLWNNRSLGLQTFDTWSSWYHRSVSWLSHIRQGQGGFNQSILRPPNCRCNCHIWGGNRCGHYYCLLTGWDWYSPTWPAVYSIVHSKRCQGREKP